MFRLEVSHLQALTILLPDAMPQNVGAAFLVFCSWVLVQVDAFGLTGKASGSTFVRA